MMPATAPSPDLPRTVSGVLDHFVAWLARYGELSWDHQSIFAGPVGRRAKAFYYRHPLPGTVVVGPMIFCEAILPAARRLFHHPVRLPIADAHYAMGFAFLHAATGGAGHFERARHFLDVLQATRSPGFTEFCWGYPFDWITRHGVIPSGTPLITTTPYVFEAFLQAQQLRPCDDWENLLRSITRHAATDIKDQPYSDTASTCSYMPQGEFRVVNASAYRAALLLTAAHRFGDEALRDTATRNLNFVLQTQQPDGSWPYAVDGVRDFVDHFHTCFVMKALAKIHRLTGDPACLNALARGVDYYLKNLFAADGLPRPFAKAPRLTVYRRELYDCAECINLCLLLRQPFPRLQATLDAVVTEITRHWVKPDGSFRSRQLMVGWDNVPMHRWAQSQMFRSLAFYLRETKTGGLKT
jgi:hypothetical protein